MSPSLTDRAIDAVWRIESARLIAGLTRIVRDVAVAEDLAQDAFLAALQQWPTSGIPDKPGAWLMATAKRRGIDALRRRVALQRKHGAGEHWMRPALCAKALRLGRILAALMPGEPEAHGLLALMELQASRLKARVGPDGEPIVLADQNRARWDHLLVQRGLAGLQRAEELSGALGPYTLQAAIAACHARAGSLEETDWPRIVALYDSLAALTGSPIVELNRAVAVTMAFGPETGLELVDSLAEESALRGYHLLPSVRGDLLVRLGRLSEAREEFERAAALCENQRERELLLTRASSLVNSTPAGRSRT